MTGLFFSGCKDDNDSGDSEWKTENEVFFNNLASRSDLYRVDAGSGSGYLYYKVLKSGSADQKRPVYTDSINVYYTGATLAGFDISGDTIVAGKWFDTSYIDGKYVEDGIYKPAGFRMNKLIEGWWVALQEMRPGDKWQLYIPWQLGYKEAGSGTTIPGYSVLIFDVELVSVIQ
ncbi:MAG: FKBP-type peptidyl-prolyl cis-trans isomerase [Candidatus Azobacteroides sp.]|nr:FKBP-type peptidyl-prolyl cis-trans isomerase [Candidatus Azobacteroides sp.]